MVICAEGIPRILIPEPSPIVPNIPLSDSLMRVVFPSLRLHRRRGCGLEPWREMTTLYVSWNLESGV